MGAIQKYLCRAHLSQSGLLYIFKMVKRAFLFVSLLLFCSHEWDNPNDPDNYPSYIVTYSYKPLKAKRIVVNDNYAYVASTDSGIVVFNISNPEELEYISSLKSSRWIKDFFICRDYLFLQSYDSLFIYTLKDSKSPKLLSSTPSYLQLYSFRGELFGIVTIMDTLGVSVYFKIFDRSKLPKLSEISNLPLEGWGEALWVDSIYAYLLVRSYDPMGYRELRTIEVIDISDFSNPQKVRSLYIKGISVWGWFENICVRDSTVYLWNDRFWYAPLKDTLSFSEFMEHADVVKFYRDSLYVGNRNVLEIYDLTSLPPLKVGEYPLPDFFPDIAVKGNYTFIAAWQHGLLVIKESE